MGLQEAVVNVSETLKVLSELRDDMNQRLLRVPDQFIGPWRGQLTSLSAALSNKAQDLYAILRALEREALELPNLASNAESMVSQIEQQAKGRTR